MRKIIFFYLIMFLSDANSQILNMDERKGKDLETISTQTFIFKVDNKDSSFTQFGYFATGNDAHTGVRGIAFDEEYVYLSDTWHKSVKKVDIQKGEIVANKRLNARNKFTLADITVFNDNLYVITDDTVVFILDKNLTLLNTLSVPQDYNKNLGERKPIYWQTQDTLILHPELEHGKQLSDFRIPVKLIYIDKNNRITSEIKLLKPNEYPLIRGYIKGKKYEILKQDGKYYFITEYGKLPLQSDIPTLKRYGAINFDFNESTLVYFDMDSSKFVLTVIRYK